MLADSAGLVKELKTEGLSGLSGVAVVTPPSRMDNTAGANAMSPNQRSSSLDPNAVKEIKKEIKAAEYNVEKNGVLSKTLEISKTAMLIKYKNVSDPEVRLEKALSDVAADPKLSTGDTAILGRWKDMGKAKARLETYQKVMRDNATTYSSDDEVLEAEPKAKAIKYQVAVKKAAAAEAKANEPVRGKVFLGVPASGKSTLGANGDMLKEGIAKYANVAASDVVVTTSR